MTFAEFVEKLEADRSASAFIEADRRKEIDYLKASAARFERIAQWIPASAGPLRVLDIGTTPFTFFIKRTFPHYEVWTLDRTRLLKQRCQRADVRLVACDLDEGRLPFEDELYDVVVFTEVLEHVFAPPTEILKEVRRILKPSGKLILGVPNIARLSKRVKLLVGLSPLPGADHQMNKDWQHGHGHIHEYTRRELLSICRSTRLKILKTRMLSATSPLRMLQRKSKFGVAKFLYYSILALFPSLRGSIYVQCCK